jgi:hypothetical protein
LAEKTSGNQLQPSLPLVFFVNSNRTSQLRFQKSQVATWQHIMGAGLLAPICWHVANDCCIRGATMSNTHQRKLLQLKMDCIAHANFTHTLAARASPAFLRCCCGCAGARSLSGLNFRPSTPGLLIKYRSAEIA